MDRLLFYRTTDGGETWAAETVTFDGIVGPILPLASLEFEGGVGVVVLAGVRYPDRGGRGRYLFLSSDDEARTWKAPVAITDLLPMDDPSTFIQIAATGSRLAVTYIESTGNWIQGQMKCRLVLSDDGGRTWDHLPLEDFYRGTALLSALHADPTSPRILFSTGICFVPQGGSRNYLTVQEISTRLLPGTRPATPEEEAEIARLIESLGVVEWEGRDAATRRLATLGRVARAALQEAAASSDDREVRSRAEALLDEIFSPCLRLDER
jgi:hypothetical protein